MRLLGKALTFDDVLLVPAFSQVLPRDTRLATRLSRHIALNLPLVSAAMDTVTEARLAIAIAQEGGIGIVHKNLQPKAQAAEVARVKRYESGVLRDPITVTPDMPVREVMALSRAHGISGFPVLQGKQVVGIVTNRDLPTLLPGSTSTWTLDGAGPAGKSRVKAVATESLDQVGPVTRAEGPGIHIQQARKHPLGEGRSLRPGAGRRHDRSGPIAINEVDCTVGELVDLARSAVEKEAGLAEAQFAVALQDPEVELCCDRSLVARAIGKLIDNAIKFSPRGSRITIGAALTKSGELAFLVKDNGSGVAPERLAQLMHPFAQTDMSLRRSREGLGLGLPLVQAIAEAHQGRFRLDSALGEGSRALLLLPAARVISLHVDLQARGHRSTDADPAAGRGRSANRRILLVHQRGSFGELQNLGKVQGGGRLGRTRARSGTGGNQAQNDPEEAHRPQHAGDDHGGDGQGWSALP